MDLSEIAATVNDAASVPEVAESICGISVQYRGNRAYCLCPMPDHNDHSIGSCVLNEKFGHCFACNESFDAIALVQMTQNVSFMEAVRILSDFYGLDITFDRDAEQVEPVYIPADIFRFAGITDVASFKKLYEQDKETAFRYLGVMIAAAKNKYRKCNTVGFPDEITQRVQHRIAVLQKADKMLPTWKAESANKPLRIK